MIDPRMSLCAAALALLACVAAPAAAEDAATVPDLVELMRGTWKIVKDDGKVEQDCDKGQTFTPTADRQHILLTMSPDPTTANYRVIHADGNRLLTYIEDEERQTDQGDPVLWWAYFRDEDHFRWRRYDWAATSGVPAEWVRCPASAEKDTAAK